MKGTEVHTRPAAAQRRIIPRISVASWVLYDLANTIFSLNIVSFYFSLWVVNVMGGSDTNYGLTVSVSMVIILLVSPFLGALTDHAPRRIPFLVTSTLVCVGFTLLLGQGGLIFSLICFAVANIGYQAGLQFYDALLPEVSQEENRGRIGGLGVGIGYLGSLVGLAVGQALLRNVEVLHPTEQTAQYRSVFQWSAVLFLLFALPCFFFIRERARPRHFSLASVGAAVWQVTTTVRSMRHYPGLVRFLVGRFFYTDAVNTLIFFMAIYMTNEVGFTTEELNQVMFYAILFSFVGGLVWGRIVDWIGPKRSLNFVLYLWMLVFAWVALAGFLKTPSVFFWPVPLLAGIGLGGTWAADRPYMLRLTPPDRIGEFYGFYGMVGRFAAVTGPLIWALVADVVGFGRPTAVLTLMAAVIISHMVLRPVSDRREDTGLMLPV